VPRSFVEKHGAVIVENHLNMIRPEGSNRPRVSTAAVAAVLNSAIVDEAFRCISGSVAVSAFELEALPLPSVEEMLAIEDLIRRGADPMLIDTYLRKFYLPRVSANAASPALAAR
jgi:adenine-specific DNA-methyltransferase